MKKLYALAAVLFIGGAAVAQNDVSFAVDMNNYSGTFTTVYVSGDFNSWSGNANALSDSDNDGVWTGTISVTADSIEWKYSLDNWAGSEQLTSGSSCTKTTSGFTNRFGEILGDTTFAQTCYEECTLCSSVPVLPTYDITVNVDVSSIAACGTVDSVTLAGPINGWGGELMSDPDGDGVWSITYNDVDSGDFQFKARFHENGNTNWEGGGNKIITVSSDTVVATRCFGNDTYGPCTAVPATADVTFIVDFTQAAFTPADTIYLMGAFTQWDANAVAMVPHSVAGQYIATEANYCPGTMEYRFSNGDPTNTSNHEPVPMACGVDNGVGGYNRFFARSGSADTVQHIFGQCSFIAVEEDALSGVSIRPNPMNESATITLGNVGRYSVRVFDITGRVVAGFDNVQGNITLERNNMVSGMYYVNIADANGATKTLKVVVE